MPSVWSTSPTTELMEGLETVLDHLDLPDLNLSDVWMRARGEYNATESARERELMTLIEDFKRNLQTHQELRSIVLIVLYIPIFCMAFAGNIMVLLVVMLNRHMRNVTNVLLLNLAVADLSVSLVCVPMAVGQSVYMAWIYGAFMCKFTGFLQGTTVAASVFTIALLSLDRFLAIKKPMVFRRLSSTKNAIKMITIVWFLAAMVMLPLIFEKELDVVLVYGHNVPFCREKWPSHLDRLIYDSCLCVIVYVLPGSVIVTSYVLIGRQLWNEGDELLRCGAEVNKGISRQLMSGRKRIAKMLVALAALFAICWLPYHTVSLYLDIDQANVNHLLTALPYTILIGHSNSAINPILYFYASKGFRRCLRKFLNCKKYGISHDSPIHMVIRYNPQSGAVRSDVTKNPLIRIFSSGTASWHRSHSSGSLRFSRSTSLRSSRSSRSSGSLRKKPIEMKPMNKIKEMKEYKEFKEMKEASIAHCIEQQNRLNQNIPQICVDEQSGQNATMTAELAELSKRRRDIFNCRLSIPTTINEESSRSRSPSPLPYSYDAPPSPYASDERPNFLTTNFFPIDFRTNQYD